MENFYKTADATVYVNAEKGEGCVVCGKKAVKGVHHLTRSGEIDILSVCDDIKHADLMALPVSRKGLVHIPARID